MAQHFSATLYLAYLSTMILLRNLPVLASDVDQDARLGTADLIRKYGYKAEVHKVTTEDGYILEVDRIPVSSEQIAAKRISPVLLLHGVLGNAANWVANFPSQSPGYLTADAGFDVWLLNQRGVPESNFHTTLTTNDEEFWQWSFDEIGRYDVPAVVDHILNVTGSSKVGLLGTSQGFTNALVFLSMRPEYNDKAVNDAFTNGGFLVSSQQQKNLVATVCNSPLRDICYSPLALIHGTNPKQLNRTRIPVYIANGPVGTSSQDLVHFAQVFRAQNFVRFDYGKKENKARYGQETPPAYPLEKIQVPVALFRGKADVFADPRDVDDLSQKLHQVVVSDVMVEDPRFGHLDFVFGYNATDILHRPMIDLLKNYTST